MITKSTLAPRAAGLAGKDWWNAGRAGRSCFTNAVDHDLCNGSTKGQGGSTRNSAQIGPCAPDRVQGSGSSVAPGAWLCCASLDMALSRWVHHYPGRYRTRSSVARAALHAFRIFLHTTNKMQTHMSTA